MLSRKDGGERFHVAQLRGVLDNLARASTVRRRWRRPDESVEPRVRGLVAEHLGVGPEELSPGVSLTDDLAADSLDLVELALACEEELQLTIPESVVEEIRTYGDLVDAVQALDRRRRAALADAESSRDPLFVWVRIVPPGDRARGDLQRAGWLTPYTAQEIVEDALRSGRDSRVKVTVPSDVSRAGVARLRDQLAWLGDRGLRVSVRRDHRAGARYPDVAA